MTLVPGRLIVVAFLVAMAGAAGASVASAPPAAAHAQVEGTSPSSGEQLASSPTTLSVRFDERVEVTFGALRLFTAQGRPLPVGSVRRLAQDTAIQADVADLPTGGYLVAWRVVSGDGHPVQGAFTFTVGSAPASVDATVVERVLSTSTP